MSTRPDPPQDYIEAELDILHVVTSDYADDRICAELQGVLKEVRERFNLDVVFVSQITDGRRTFKVVDQRDGLDILRPGMSDPVEQSWCGMIVAGRLPEFIQDGRVLQASGAVPRVALEIGTHLSVPVVMSDGRVYGTLCSFAFFVNNEVSPKDVEHLRATARSVAAVIEEHA